MARIYEGTVRIVLHPVKGIQLTRGNTKSTLTAADAAQIADIMVEAATNNKVGMDRYSFYVPEVSQKLAKDDKQLSLTKAKAALKNPENEVTLVAAQYGLPKLVVAPKVTTTKKKSNIIEIA